MIDKSHFEQQREFEKQAQAGELDVPREILKMYKFRMIVSKAWLPMGITRDEAVDILLWAVGDDVTRLHFSHWPERIMDNTGVKFDPKTDTVISVMRRVAKVWQSKKVKPYYTGV